MSELGAHVTGLIASQYNTNLFTQLELEDLIDHRIGDIRNLSLLFDLINEIKPDVVFHLAAQPLVRLSYKEPLATWDVNVMGTLHLLEALRSAKHSCVAIMITTDKVYSNKEWLYGYRENDSLGGHDPYSSSKAAAEIAIDSWRSSFCGDLPHQTKYLHVASARAGNVIGGGDWSKDRIVPDIMYALSLGKVLEVRNPNATRPWQHVLEPLSGYLLLAQSLSERADLATAFNFGPQLDSNCSVSELVETALSHWPGVWIDQCDPNAPHEAALLNLVIDRAYHQLGWSPKWDFETTVERTVNWYRGVLTGASTALECCQEDLSAYLRTF